MMTFNKKNCLNLLKYKKYVEKNFQQKLSDYDSKKYFELQKQLGYVKDFIIWKQSFLQYFKLFENFKNGLIDGDSFVDEFFDLFNKDQELLDQKLLENFILTSNNFKNLNINPKSSGLGFFLEETSMECDLFQNDSDIRLVGEIDEDQLRSYIKKMYIVLHSFK